MKTKGRSISPFNLSFLDIMFCGFGAVVLLVLIINANILSDTKEKYQDLTGEVDKVALQITAAKQYHRNLQEVLQNNQNKEQKIQSRIHQINTQLSEIESMTRQDKQQTAAVREHINALKSDLKSIDKNNAIQKNKILESINETGNKVRQYEGEGNRQYLTGLKLGGKRVAILLDSSASMLDETIVNIIVKRNMSDEIKRNTKKWQQAVNIVRWLVANLPKNSQVLLISFNDNVSALDQGHSLQWVGSQDEKALNAMINNLFTVIPEKGTSLSKVFHAVKKMKQKPDNIILITDGLPTQGLTKPTKTKVDAAERIDLFKQAIKLLPSGIPVNTLLLPMEGDPMAASLFWKLAIDTQGSFITPSHDWP